MAAVPCTVVQGQPVFEHKASLEWLAADSDVVVRATVANVAPDSSESYDVWYTVTLKVHETLKGTHRATIKLIVRRWRSDEDLAEWRKQRREFLLFLVDSKRYEREESGYTKFKWAPQFVSHGVPAFVHFDEKAKSNPLTLDLKVPTERQDIIERTRAAVAAAADAKPTVKYVFRWYGGIVFWTFPVDRRLETAARRWIRSPNDFMPSGANVEGFLKAEGAAALRHFKSEKNATILKTLLNDPAVTHKLEEDRWQAAEVREFYVRQAAYETLQEWDVPVEKPVLREQVLRKVTARDERAAITWIESIEGDVVYYDMRCPDSGTGRFRTVKSVNLASASLHGHRVDDLSPLTTLKNLESLTLTSTAVRDLSPLTELKNLRSLRLWDTPVTDLSPLAKVKTLASLELGGPVSDLSPLAGLQSLVGLDLGHTQVRDLSPLARLENLQYLDLSTTPVRDLSPLAGVENLKDLSLHNTQISDLSPLSGMGNLKSLRLDETPVTDLTPLAKLTSLENLNLASTPVSNLTPLAKLQHLKRLDLSNTRVSDISPLKSMNCLSSVFLNGAPLGEEEARRFRDSLQD